MVQNAAVPAAPGGPPSRADLADPVPASVPAAHQASLWTVALGAVGVVYGDIGTSPLYAMRETIAAATGQMAFSPGGVLIRDAAGTLIGAVGISGDTGECDEACAIAGIDAAGLFHGDRK